MRGAIIFLALTCLLMISTQAYLERQRTELAKEMQALHQALEVQAQKQDLSRQLLQEVIRLRSENEELHRRLRQWLDTWQVDSYEATAYAPFDATPGSLCHDGNPNITAAGTRPAPGTIAVDPRHIPYGTPLWVEGYGWGRALDTGAAMRSAPRRLDLFFQTRSAALAWGRRTVRVVLPREGVSI